jgi:type I restriction enzyme R subunit
MQNTESWSEGRTIRDLVLPSLRSAEWAEASWHREYPITVGGRQVVDGRVRQSRPLRADIGLLHGERPIAVVEVKKTIRDHLLGVQQARRYAELLDVPLAYATNGHRITEIDMRAQHDWITPISNL